MQKLLVVKRNDKGNCTYYGGSLEFNIKSDNFNLDVRRSKMIDELVVLDKMVPMIRNKCTCEYTDHAAGLLVQSFIDCNMNVTEGVTLEKVDPLHFILRTSDGGSVYIDFNSSEYLLEKAKASFTTV